MREKEGTVLVLVVAGLVSFEPHATSATNSCTAHGSVTAISQDNSGLATIYQFGLGWLETSEAQQKALMTDTIIERSAAHGLRLTEQRKVIAKVLEEADDHPDVEELHARAVAIDANISIATVYRTVKLFEESGILERHEFGDGRARYEDADRDHHDHLIDMQTGEVIEFVDPDIEALQEKIAERLGYRLKGHRLELYGVKAHPK